MPHTELHTKKKGRVVWVHLGPVAGTGYWPCFVDRYAEIFQKAIHELVGYGTVEMIDVFMPLLFIFIAMSKSGC